MGTGVLPRVAGALARVSARWVPDAFSIAALLTLATVGLALAFGNQGLAGCVGAWGDGLWALLPFSMQIALVIFAGYVLAVSPAVRRVLEGLAGLPREPRQVVAFTAFLSMLLCWLNWGVGLIASAVLVRAMARRHADVDYRLLVAVAYLGMGTTWHAGPSGSVPLLLATPRDNFMIDGGLIPAPIGLAHTILAPLNLGLMAVVLLGFSALAARLHPSADRTVRADREALEGLGAFEPPPRPAEATPAARLMHGPWLNGIMGVMGLAYLGLQVSAGRFALTLDTVNLAVLSGALLLHPSPASLVKAAEEAARPLHGVVLQFPLYAGIYGIIKGTGLAEVLAQLFVSVASARTLPFVVFVYSAVLNYWVPSGGAKWAMEAEYLLQAARTLGVGTPDLVMAYAYGDMATNLIQPFWAIPLLGVARLEFRDILGYEILVLAAYAALMSGALLLL